MTMLWNHAHQLCYPLDEFYAAAGTAMPDITEIPGSDMPQPYRGLLVHDGDMTPTLERFHRSDIHLRILSRRVRGDSLFREVVLMTDKGERPVEFGAIRINLAPFPPQAQRDIQEGHLPLGTILARCGVEHQNHPAGFLRVVSDPVINDALGLDLSHVHALYGRRNVLLAPSGEHLAEVVEILPPLPPADQGENHGG